MSTPRFPAYDRAARRCAGGPQPGALALMEWATKDWNEGGIFNLGIYNCRTVRGSAQRSVHGDGRACDFGFPLVDGAANPAGWDLVRLLLPMVGSLGIQQIIWDRRVWSAAHPNGAPYTGVSPHIDHIHAELTREAGQILTRARIKATVAATTDRPVADEEDIMATAQELEAIVRKVVAEENGKTRTWIREELVRVVKSLVAEIRKR